MNRVARFRHLEEADLRDLTRSELSYFHESLFDLGDLGLDAPSVLERDDLEEIIPILEDELVRREPDPSLAEIEQHYVARCLLDHLREALERNAHLVISRG